MQKLIAKAPILFESKIYEVGAELPTKNPQIVEAWLEAGTAVWKDDEEPEEKSVQVRPATAEPGLAGQALSSESENGEDLVGKVPTTTVRAKAPVRKKVTTTKKK
ncbi:MAG: hypothetical protein IJV71_02640 [Lachnospiraceae bacterium]|nr:hypothetical protein [Lachnospiraceae bacterium]